MPRDKARDDRFFNCSQDHEIEYVSGLYPDNKEKVKKYLEDQCDKGDIKYATHNDVYEKIKKDLGYQIPV